MPLLFDHVKQCKKTLFCLPLGTYTLLYSFHILTPPLRKQVVKRIILSLLPPSFEPIFSEKANNYFHHEAQFHIYAIQGNKGRQRQRLLDCEAVKKQYNQCTVLRYMEPN